MLDIEEIKRHLQYMVLSHVAADAGVDRNTLHRIKVGLASRPSHSTIKALSEFILGLRCGSSHDK